MVATIYLEKYLDTLQDLGHNFFSFRRKYLSFRMSSNMACYIYQFISEFNKEPEKRTIDTK